MKSWITLGLKTSGFKTSVMIACISCPILYYFVFDTKQKFWSIKRSIKDKKAKKSKDNLLRDKRFIDERIKMMDNFILNRAKNCNEAARDIHCEFQKIPSSSEYKIDTASECPDYINMSCRVDIWLSPQKKNIKLAIIIPPDALENIGKYPSYYETFLFNEEGEKIFDKELGYENIHHYYKNFWSLDSLYNEIYFIKDMIRKQGLYQ